MKQLELKLGDAIIMPSIVDEITGAVSIAYLKGIEAGISRRDDINTEEKRIYYNIVERRIRAIEDYGKR